ncbi:flagellar brake protein [Agaribacterium haliotis]|uniref:flagellar brake protein n=1 Tax=Agaribacterium haliotis TaxID=2013869 RepID=UPI000BB53E07|nr:flagellar brake protein [Agaribacterium haliotis]
MSSETAASFDDLNLKLGQIVQIHPDVKNPKRRYDCLLVGSLPGESILLTTSPKSDAFPELEEGQMVVIRIMSANGVALFQTRVLFISDMPVFMVYVDFPSAVQFRMVRSSSRVEIALPVLVYSLSHPSLSGVAGKISDISLGGAGLQLYDDIGAVGDMLELKGKFEVGGIQRTVKLKAEIRNKKAEASGNRLYGIRFSESDEDKLLVLFGFIFNSMAFGDVQSVS